MHGGAFGIQKIISGGQTGADRAGLDWAIANGIPHGGWCPLGRKAEDGPIPAVYALEETPRADYLQRNEWNVRDSDATVIFTVTHRLSGGSLRTSSFANRLVRPWLHLSLEDDGIPRAVARLVGLLENQTVRVLNVAGSRGSKEPTVAAFVHAVLNAYAESRR